MVGKLQGYNGTHPRGGTLHPPLLLALTAGVHLGEIIEDAATGTIRLDQVTCLQGHGPHKILPGWVFLQRDAVHLRACPSRCPALPVPAGPCGHHPCQGWGRPGAHRVLDTVVDDHVVVAQGQPGAQGDEIPVLQGARAFPCRQTLLHPNPLPPWIHTHA